MDQQLVKTTKEKMEKSLEALRHDLAKLRTGRASAALLEGLGVEYFGSSMPVNQVGTISVPDSRTLVITPWDKNAITEIERAIQKSDLGLQPVSDGKLVRISIPKLTEERRKDLVKVAKKNAESARVSVRNVRRDINEKLKKMKKDGELSEDDLKKNEHEVQELTDRYIKEVDTVLEKKEEEIMTV